MKRKYRSTKLRGGRGRQGSTIFCEIQRNTFFCKEDKTLNGCTDLNAHEFYRPNELHELIGDASKAKASLGWQPEITFEDLVREMVEKQ